MCNFLICSSASYSTGLSALPKILHKRIARMIKKKCGGEELWIIVVKEDVTLLKKDWSKQIDKQIVGKQITILVSIV